VGGAFTTNGVEEERVYVIAGKARRKIPLRKPMRTWVDNIRIDLGEVG
jgi:hypothetical protein